MNKVFWSSLTVLFLLGILLFYACSNKTKDIQESTTLSTQDKIEKTAKKLFKQDYTLAYNASKTVVCISKSLKVRPNEQYPTLSFALYHIKNETILFQETIPRAKGEWIDDDQFKVITIPGIIPTTRDSKKMSGFIYHIGKRIKQPL